MACRKELAPTEKNDPGASTGATLVWRCDPTLANRRSFLIESHALWSILTSASAF